MMRPALPRRSGPVPKAVTRPTAPGRLATQTDTATIHSMPAPISRQKNPSKPNGNATTPAIPAGMIQNDTIGMVRRLVSTP